MADDQKEQKKESEKKSEEQYVDPNSGAAPQPGAAVYDPQKAAADMAVEHSGEDPTANDQDGEDSKDEDSKSSSGSGAKKK